MRILLDENLPESLVAALRRLGHQVDPVNSLRLKGLDNGALYRQVAQNYDLCFTKDTGFVNNVRQIQTPSRVKLLRVSLPQQPARILVDNFVVTFQRTDWSTYENGHDWPRP